MNRIDRRDFLKSVSVGGAALISAERVFANENGSNRPNIILCMSDDQGWGDTGYNGHPVLKTPHLDSMSREGIRFDRFYSGAPVCSPTRGSCLTGRHPYRYGIFYANVGHIKKEEITLAEALKTQGYTTGHFGKWHLGTLTTKIKDSNRGQPGDAAHYSPPWQNGFDRCFSTEAKVPTWNPMITPKGWQNSPGGEPFGTYYWSGPDRKVTDNLEGDDSRIIMDRAIPFIRNAVKSQTPFFTVIWFHAPHLPVVAGPKHLDMYPNHPGAHFLGCITALDEQMGRLRGELRTLGVDRNTMLWFCSDNGPEGKTDTDANGTAGPFRGRKRSLYEGGVRVPGLLVWPGRIEKPRVVKTPYSTSDYFPTVLDSLGFQMKGKSEPADGISLLPLIDGAMDKRPRPIAFESNNQVSLTDNRYKIYSSDKGKTFELYDLIADPGERNDLAKEKPDIVTRMKKTLETWRISCQSSLAGRDYK